MAKRKYTVQETVSDISGQVINPKDQIVRVTVAHHQGVDRPVRIDASVEEVRELLASGKDAVVLSLESDDPHLPSRLIMEREDFELQFKGEALTILKAAAQAPQRNRSSVKGVDYRQPDMYGVLHRGRVTDAEKELVQNNLEQAQANRRRAGQRALDPTDHKECERYDLPQPSATDRPLPRPRPTASENM